MKYYIAYGSNINKAQMAHRCPDASVVCTGTLEDYELVFRGSSASAVATVERKAGASVPVVVWKISRNDEKALDVYEGYPRLYIKEILNVNSDTGKSIRAMAYVMTPGRKIGGPSKYYLGVISQGYDDFGFDKVPLFATAKANLSAALKHHSEIAQIAELQKNGDYTLCPRCGEATMKERLHTNATSRRANIYICDTCGMMEAINDAKGISDGLEYWNCIKKQRNNA